VKTKTSYDHIQTGIWQIWLPDDWVEQEPSGSSGLRFESADGEKAFFVSTWDLKKHKKATSCETAEKFLQTDLNSLFKMEGCTWEVLNRSVVEIGAVAVGTAECFASNQAYRIVSRILVRMPIVVRASFHDYSCQDLPGSRQFFVSIIDSLSLLSPFLSSIHRGHFYE